MVVYLDNNATTVMPREVISAMVAWCNKGNPSSSYQSAVEAKQMINDFRQFIGRCCGIDIDSPAWQIIFTSGASESNATMLSSVVDSWWETRRSIPHLVISTIEHKSILLAAEDYVARGRATATFVKPAASGHISRREIDAAITPNTALVSVMHANNETGAVNNVFELAAAAHARGVPFYTDTVQTFGKMPLRPGDLIDGFCVSFHKLHGPPGVGALIARTSIIRPIIYGTQNGGFRGGTENVPGLGASFAALRLTMTNRADKNAAMAAKRDSLLAALSRRIKVIPYSSYPGDMRYQQAPFIVVLGGIGGAATPYLPNTILLSVIRWSPPSVCNAKFKERLACAGIIVSIGSACNTSSDKASHVLDAMGADKYIRAGTLRISLGDDTTDADISSFIREFCKIFSEL